MAATTTPLASENWGWTPDFESGDRNRGDGFHPLSERGLSHQWVNSRWFFTTYLVGGFKHGWIIFHFIYG